MSLPKLFERIFWHNNTTPAVNETNLNAMSKGLSDVDDRLISLGGLIMETVPEIQQDMEILGPAVESIDDNVAAAQASAETAEEQALKSEGFAVGEQDGVPVGSDSEYFENNAEYFANIANPPIRVIKDFAPIISITDAINKKARDVRIKVEPVQDLHGYTKPWVGGAGKNKLKNNITSATRNGVEFTVNSDGSMKLNNTCTGWQFININYEANKLSIPSGDWIYTGGTSGLIISIYVDGTRIAQASSASPVSFTVPANASTSYARYEIAADVSFNNVMIYPMIRSASESDASWAPFENICPITGHSEAKVTRAGKNLLEGMESGAIDQSTGQNTSGSATRSINHIGVVPSTSYTISGLLIEGGAIRVFKYDSSKAYLGNEVVNFSSYKATLTIASGVYYIRFQGGETTFTPTTQVQVEVGTIATAYEPFVASDVYTIDLNGTRYGGVLDVTSGVLTLTHGFIEFDGSLDEDWVSAGDNQFYIAKTDAKNKAYIITNEYEGVSVTSWSNLQNGQISTHPSSSNNILRFRDDSLADVTALRAKFATTPLQVVYELATPQTITITPAQIDLLFGYNTLFADTGDVYLEYDASGIIHIAEGKLDIDVFKAVTAASSDFADFKTRVAAL